MESGKCQRRFKELVKFSVKVMELEASGACPPALRAGKAAYTFQPGTEKTAENHRISGLEGTRKALEPPTV